MTSEADDKVHPLKNSSDVVPFLRDFASSALRTIDIFSHQLASPIYNDGELVDAISQLARRGPQTKIRILVRDTRSLQGTDHPLVRLAQRLPSHILIRAYIEGAQDEQMGFFCADAAHLVHFLDESDLKGYARRNGRAEARHLLAEFEHLWVYGSKADKNLLRLSL